MNAKPYLFCTLNRLCALGFVALTSVLLVACVAPPQTTPSDDSKKRECVAAQADSPFIGNWLSVRKQAGVVGELHTQIILHVDGRMAYTEQLRRSDRLPQMLVETGCWQAENNALIMQTVQSISVDVELDDPIYRNRYDVIKLGDKRLELDGPEGRLSLRQTADDYRLPVF